MTSPAPHSPRVLRVAAVCLLRRSSAGAPPGPEILATKRLPTGRGANLWEFPGGKLEPGESPVEAATRELREELGVGAVKLSLFDEFEHDYGDLVIWLTLFLGELGPGAELHALQVSEFRWMRIEETATLHWLPANQRVLQRLRAWIAEGAVWPDRA